jgi:hypothetical protein
MKIVRLNYSKAITLQKSYYTISPLAPNVSFRFIFMLSEDIKQEPAQEFQLLFTFHISSHMHV